MLSQLSNQCPIVSIRINFAFSEPFFDFLFPRPEECEVDVQEASLRLQISMNCLMSLTSEGMVGDERGNVDGLVGVG